MSSLKATLLVLTIGLLPSLALAAEAPAPAAPFTDAQKAAIESMVRDLVVNKEPEIVMQAAKNLQDKMEKVETAKGQAAVGKNLDKLMKDPTSPVGWNPKGDVTVVEFFDYSCGYCKMAQEILSKFAAEDKNVRLVYKEFPILGAGSVYASKAALASVSQGKYVAFHEALMGTKDHMSEDVVKKIAKDVGIDVEKMVKEMEGDKIKSIIKANQDLAGEIGVRGTPGFIIGEKIFPGALSVEQLKESIAEARKAAKK